MRMIRRFDNRRRREIVLGAASVVGVIGILAATSPVRAADLDVGPGYGSYDRGRSIQANTAAEHLRIAVEGANPKPVADENGRILELASIARKSAAHRWMNPQGGEKLGVGADRHQEQRLRSDIHRKRSEDEAAQ